MGQPLQDAVQGWEEALLGLLQAQQHDAISGWEEVAPNNNEPGMVHNMDATCMVHNMEVFLDYFQLHIMQFREKKLLLD